MADFGAGLSENHDPVAAAREVLDAVGDQLGEGARVDLALLFVTPPHLTALEAIAAEVRSALDPVTLMGCGAVGVVGGAREVERTPAVSLWAARGTPVDARYFPAPSPTEPDAEDLTEGMAELLDGEVEALMVLADPFSASVDLLLSRLAEERPGLAVVGGMASAASRPGGNRLVFDDAVHSAGMIVAALRPPTMVRTVVSQGCRPVGTPLVVTRAERNVVYELAGRPALERLGEVAESMPEGDRHLLDHGIHLGRVIDEHRSDFERGDFLVRNVIGGDVSSGAIAVGDVIEVGATVRYQVRDAASADEDLRDLMGGSRAGAALLFTCNGRGRNLFAEPDHDAGVVSTEIGHVPLAGMFCAGELGPIGGQNFLHGFTASVALLDVVEPPSPTGPRPGGSAGTET